MKSFACAMLLSAMLSLPCHAGAGPDGPAVPHGNTATNGAFDLGTQQSDAEEIARRRAIAREQPVAPVPAPVNWLGARISEPPRQEPLKPIYWTTSALLGWQAHETLWIILLAMQVAVFASVAFYLQTEVHRGQTPMPAVPGTDARQSFLAMASLICSFVPFIGSIPGIICGHLANREIRWNPAIRGQKLATTGLIISYLTLVAFASIPLKHAFLDSKPVPIVRKDDNTLPVSENRLVDEVKIADPDSEQAHVLKGASTLGNPFNEKLARSAVKHGWFSYKMKVLPHHAVGLFCTYVTSNRLPHVCAILVNGQPIAKQDLLEEGAVHYLDMEYEIPESLTRGHDSVTLRFEAEGDYDSGRLYVCQILRR